MDDETMYLIHGEDYLTHIYEKVEMYLLLKQLISEVDEIPPCPANHDAKEMAIALRDISDNIFADWNIPESFLSDGDEDDLCDLMDSELFAPEEAGYELSEDMRDDDDDGSDEYFEYDEAQAAELQKICGELAAIVARLVKCSAGKAQDA